MIDNLDRKPHFSFAGFRENLRFQHDERGIVERLYGTRRIKERLRTTFHCIYDDSTAQRREMFDDFRATLKTQHSYRAKCRKRGRSGRLGDYERPTFRVAYSGSYSEELDLWDFYDEEIEQTR